MSRKTKKIEVDNIVSLESTELEFCDATDLLADMTAVVGPAGAAWQGGLSNRGEAAAMLAREFSGGLLTRHLARLLACTTLIAKGENGGKGEKVELIDSRAKLNQAFTGRQKYIGPAVKIALEVSFSDFLDAFKLLGWKIPTLSPSGDSTPSTTDIG